MSHWQRAAFGEDFGQKGDARFLCYMDRSAELPRDVPSVLRGGQNIHGLLERNRATFLDLKKYRAFCYRNGIQHDIQHFQKAQCELNINFIIPGSVEEQKILFNPSPFKIKKSIHSF